MEPGTCHTDKMRRGGEKAQSDSSKTDRACATTLTADTDNETARLVVNCLKFHSISCKTRPLDLFLNSKLILFSFIAMFWCLAQPEKYQNSFFDVFLLSSHQTAYSPSCSEVDWKVMISFLSIFFFQNSRKFFSSFAAFFLSSRSPSSYN